MSRLESSFEMDMQNPAADVEAEKPFDYDELPAVNSVVDSVVEENKNAATLEEQEQLKNLNFDLKKIEKSQVGIFDKFKKKWLAPILAVSGLVGGMASKKYQEFDEIKNETVQLLAAENEFVVPELPDSVLIMPEDAEIAQTKDLFRQFERYVKDHEEKGLDLSVEESGPGLLGVYLKFGRQIDRSVKFSEKFLPELAKRLGVSEEELQTMQEIFHKSIYIQPPTMGGGGTSSVFYTSENIFKFKDHEDFYAAQFTAAVQLAKQKIIEIQNAPKELQSKLTLALEDFLRAELAVRAYDERIKNAIAKKLNFELEGFEGAYNDSRPSIFAQQAPYLEDREKAITEWYQVLSNVDKTVIVEKNLAELAVSLQGWSEKRTIALEVSRQAAADGMVLGSDPKIWNDFVKKGDKEFKNNAQALNTLLIANKSDNLMIAAK